MEKRILSLAIAVFLVLSGCSSKDEWIVLFDGKSLNGWKAAENPDSWRVEDGTLVSRGKRSHLFYVGDGQNADFKNFELVADVKTTLGSNSGIYFHTEYQESGWPTKGYECQVINSNHPVEPGKWVELKLTGSLYAIRTIWKPQVKDDEWFNYRIVVQGKTIRTYINGRLMVDYTQPENAFRPESYEGRLLSSGTFALQGHDPKSVVFYKNLKVKPLADDLPTPGRVQEDAEFEEKIVRYSAKTIPLTDLHAHLKGGLTMDMVLENARKYGFTYGLAVNCGLKMGFETEEDLLAFLEDYEKPPETYLAMQAEGREWLDLFSEEARNRFDYVFTDSMTWTNDNGKRMRLWIPGETEVGDPQNFMDQLVDRIETILQEPIDIYVNPTYLPKELQARYDELWTPARMDRVIKALLDNDVALEINARRKIPSPTFLKRAKAAGVKFTFGTNNGGANDLGRMDYCFEMIEALDLKPGDIWSPASKNWFIK